MIKIKEILLVMLFITLSLLSSSFAQTDPMDDYFYQHAPKFLNPNLNDTLDDEVSAGVPISNPIREWAYHIVHWKNTDQKLQWIIYNDNEIKNFDDAQEWTLNLIKRWVNYALGFAALVALAYLIYHGFLMLTAVGDASRYKKWFTWLKTAVIALVGMGLSWLIISLILFVLEKVIL